jgi:phosphate transport system permease protein
MFPKIDWHQKFFLSCAVITGGLTLFIIGFIFYIASPVLVSEGFSFITGSVWDYSTGTYGIFPFIVGTLLLTAVTLAIAVPVGVLTAIYLAEWAPRWLEGILRPLIELLVGIPSVVYGIFGFFILQRFFADYINPVISGTLGRFSSFFVDPDPGCGTGVFLASTVLAVMILPTIIAISQEAMQAVHAEHREASLALGATKWETIKWVVIPIAFPGIVTAIILGMMRAMGETMAVVMLIGNTAIIPGSIMDTGYAMTSKILNDLGYYGAIPEYRSALYGIAAVLFIMEIALVAGARWIARMSVRQGR